MPAEGLEPTRSCDHWILSPARLPFRHAGVSKGSERIRTSRRSSTRESFRSQTLPTRSSGCRLRGGPKISRKIIASRKPDVDRSIVAMSIFAPAVLMWSVAQALPKIYGYAVHLFRRHRPKSVETFAVEMSFFALCPRDVGGFWSRLWSGFEKKSPARRTKGKGDYRDAALPFS